VSPDTKVDEPYRASCLQAAARELGQLSLADGLVGGGAGHNRQLERIAALVEWPAFEQLLGDIYAAPVGRPSYGPLVLLKCLLLQQ
jgi:transposase, IS5 family